MLDVVIKGGEVVDGSGRARRRADVGVADGRIVAVGELGDVDAPAIDATGRVVAPGFVDVHTHYDAQVFWDGALTPSPLHGVTTVLAGNCGFSVAPLSGDAEDGRYLMRLLARVEGMPLAALEVGVPWSWVSTADYLGAIEGTLGVNAGFMVGHSALRRTVMGPDATRREATSEELEAMCRLLHEGLEAGGLGFSSTWSRTHNDADGNMAPSRYASADELVAFCATAGDHEGTSLEFIPMAARTDPWAAELMADMSVAAQRALNWNVLTVNGSNRELVESRLAASDLAAARGGKVVALTVPVTIRTRLSFGSGFVFDAIPGWEETMLLARDERLELLRQRAVREMLRERAAHPDNTMAGLANWGNHVIYDVVCDENQPYVGRRVADIAAELGKDPFDTLLDIAVADELFTGFGISAPDTDDDWKARVEVWRDPRAVIGASDAGAHLDLLATFNYATVLLAEAVRARNLLGLEEAIHLLTDVPARLYGLVERGRIEEGWWADLVVLDPGTVGSEEVAMRFDLPAGAGRLYAGATGVEHVLVNGRAIVRTGSLTAQRPGSVIRSGSSTRTAALA